jgi:hypothetical protein
MADPNVPLRVVPTSVITYCLARGILKHRFAPGSEKLLLKAISGAHAAGITLAAILTLKNSPLHSVSIHDQPRYKPDGNLDDSGNPMIQAQSNLANSITAWETGYLIYDTWALIEHESIRAPNLKYSECIVAAARSQPFEFVHHTGLATALIYLQYYIWRGNERGIWIIVALTLMNASTPLLQTRSWLAHKGRRYIGLDLSFAIAFALSRMGAITWILQRYGAHHGLDAWTAYRRLRLPCQAGTGSIFALNTVWWLLLIRSILKRRRS